MKRINATPPIILEPSQQPATQAVIWLHGLGADGHDFEGIVPQLSPACRQSIRYVFPNAPVQPVTVNLGTQMPSWYDITSSQLTQDIDWAGIADSVKTIHQLIEAEETKGISSKNIVVAGFSQGGLIALYAALTYPKPLAGIMALSTYFPVQTESDVPKLVLADRKAGQAEPIFMAHGSADPICSFEEAERSRDRLLALGKTVLWHSYLMEHQVCEAEIKALACFLEQVLPLSEDVLGAETR